MNAYDDEIEAATAYLRNLALNDCSPLPVRTQLQVRPAAVVPDAVAAAGGVGEGD
ncbi:hypothetical protein ACQUSR_32855 [Streptomyces sp. P1-3]|uniref:hypothetical protein n=1 Tax=Streptomyces sp. P1-3 TaxID=3421658 RepID=UPI003D365006